MAGKGIEIGIASETKAFKQGIDTGLIAPLENAVDALDDLGKNKGMDKLEDGFQDAQDASKKLKREVKDTADAIEDDFRQSYAKMKRSSEDGTSNAKRDLKELGSEARQNASETFSSFDGSAESFADGIQGTLGGVVGSLGPIGAAAGAAGALGIGLVTAAFQAAQEEADKLAEATSDAFAQMLEAKSTYLTGDQILDNMQDIYQAEEKLKEATEIATKLGLDRSAVVRALAGDQAALTTVEAARKGKLDELTVAEDANSDSGKRATDYYTAQRKALTDTLGPLDRSITAHADAAKNILEYRRGVADSTVANGNNTKSVKDQAAAIKALPAVTDVKVKVTGDFTGLDRALRRPRALALDFVTRDGRRIY